VKHFMNLRGHDEVSLISNWKLKNGMPGNRFEPVMTRKSQKMRNRLDRCGDSRVAHTVGERWWERKGRGGATLSKVFGRK